MALGVPAAPAMADDRTDRIIAGAIILGIIGAGIHNSQTRDQRVTRDQPVTPLIPTVRVTPAHNNRYLPAACLHRYHTRQGDVRLFDGTCLERSFQGYRHLPLSCAVTIQSGGRYDSGFRPDCLRSAGYRLAGN